MAANTNSNTLVSGTSAADTIINDNSEAVNVTVDAGGKNDYILTRSSDSSINGGEGNDTIYNYFKTVGYTPPEYEGGSNVTLNGGAGDDSIKNVSTLVAIYGGDGNDILINDAKSVTINGGAGNDTIEIGDRLGAHHGNVIEYVAGEGDDVILNYTSEDTIKIVNGTVTGGRRGVGSNENDIILQVGDNTLTLKKGAGKVLNVIDATCEEDDPKLIESPLALTNEEADVSLSGAELNDYINNSGERVTISSDGGADYIVNSGDSASILAGNGNDTICGAQAIADAGAGDDVVYNEGENATVYGGLGDDTITLNSATWLKYARGDGNDVIYGFDETSTLEITSGVTGTFRVVDGMDVVIPVGTGTITLKDAAGKTLTWIDAKGNVKSVVYGEFDLTNESEFNVVEGTSGADRIHNKGDRATVSAGAGDDQIKNEGANVSISGGAGNDYINDLSIGSTSVNGGRRARDRVCGGRRQRRDSRLRRERFDHAYERLNHSEQDDA